MVSQDQTSTRRTRKITKMYYLPLSNKRYHKYIAPKISSYTYVFQIDTYVFQTPISLPVEEEVWSHTPNCF